MMDIAKLISSLEDYELQKFKDYLFPEIARREKIAEEKRRELESKKYERSNLNLRQKLAARSTGLVPIDDLIREIPMGRRLRSTLHDQWEYGFWYYLDDIIKMDFFRLRNVWQKTWDELMYVVDVKLSDTQFEIQQESLQKYFAIQNKIWDLHAEMRAMRQSTNKEKKAF
jgi:hypothetical protein